MNTQWERRSPRPIVFSVFAHIAAVFALSVLFSHPQVRKWAAGSVSLIVPVDIAPHLVSLRTAQGGGGLNQPLPASQGRLPRIARIQLAAPAVIPPNPSPILAVEPTLVGEPAEPVLLDFSQLGDPLGQIGPPSSGPGSRSGIGGGDSGGVGDGRGPGLDGVGIDGVYRVGRDGVTAPKLVHRVEPEYSEEARKSKWQGFVRLEIEVWPDGRPHNLRVVRSLGLGLDEKAIEAAAQWRFVPGRRDGAPVKTLASVEVNFRLL